MLDYSRFNSIKLIMNVGDTERRRQKKKLYVASERDSKSHFEIIVFLNNIRKIKQ